MKGCQSRTNKVKDEKGDLVAESQSILARYMGLMMIGRQKYTQQNR